MWDWYWSIVDHGAFAARSTLMLGTVLSAVGAVLGLAYLGAVRDERRHARERMRADD